MDVEVQIFTSHGSCGSSVECMQIGHTFMDYARGSLSWILYIFHLVDIELRVLTFHGSCTGVVPVSYVATLMNRGDGVSGGSICRSVGRF